MEHKVYRIYDAEDFTRLTKGIKVAQCMRTESLIETKDDSEILGRLDDLCVSEKLFCSFCNESFDDSARQRQHYKLDWHRYNLKKRLADRKSVSEEAFSRLADQDDMSSISGSESSTDEEMDGDASAAELKLPALKPLQAVLASRHAKVFFENDAGDILSIYRCLLHGKKDAPEKDDMFVPLALKMVKSKKWAIIMLGGGHFAAGIFDGPEAIVHKTFHCYTVRKGQGGTQSSRDSRSGGSHPKSAGASLRRYNEAALAQHVQDITTAWASDLSTCDLIFYRASGHNMAVLFGGRTPPLAKTDPRLRTVPFPTRRATYSEVKRVQEVLSSLEVYGSAEGFQNSFPQSPRKRPTKASDSAPPDAAESLVGDGNGNGPDAGESPSPKKNRGLRPAIDRAKARKSPVRPLPEIVAALAVSSAETSTDDDPDRCSDVPDWYLGSDGDAEVDTGKLLQEFEDTVPDSVKRIKTRRANRKVPKKNRVKEKKLVEKRRPEIVRFCAKLLSACDMGDSDGLCSLLTLSEHKPVDLEQDSPIPQSLVINLSDCNVNETVCNISPEEILRCINDPIDSDQNRLLHISAQGGHGKIVRLLLEAGSDPGIKNKKGHPPYVSSSNKGTRDTFRRFFAEFPDKYDYSQSQIPSGLTDELLQEQAEKKRALKKAKKERTKQKKKEDELKREEKSERDRFLSLPDREKRALAAERRMLSDAARGGGAPIVVSRCFLCATDITGKVPFEYDIHRFCSIECLKAHRMKNKSGLQIEQASDSLQSRAGGSSDDANQVGASTAQQGNWQSVPNSIHQPQSDRQWQDQPGPSKNPNEESKRYDSDKNPGAESFPSFGNSITGSAFVEKTLDNGDCEVWLQQEDIANIARTVYGWCGGNGNIAFEVIGSTEQLNVQLERCKKDLLERKQSLTYVINLHNCHWVTLVITYQNEQFLAFYIDSLGDKIQGDIRHYLEESFVGIDVQSFNIRQQNDGYNCGIFALENARVINEALQSSSEPQSKDLSDLHSSEDLLKAKREEFARALRRRMRLESKFDVLLTSLQKLNEKPLATRQFNYQNAYIFLLFLETLALQDPILQDSNCRDPTTKLLKYQEELVNQGVIDLDDLKCVQYIRSTKIIHRDDYTIISPFHLVMLVNLNENNGVAGFFKELEKYVQQIYRKLKGEIFIEIDVKQPKELLKMEIDNTRQFGKIIKSDQLKARISKFFMNATREGFRDDRLDLKKANEMLFELVVNVMPFIEKTYRKLAKPLEKIKWFRGELIHRFYEFGSSPRLMGIALKDFIRESVHYFFRYYYSQEVCKVLKESTFCKDANVINEKLKNLLNAFQKKIGKEYLAAEEDVGKENYFECVASELVYSKVNGKSSLESCVHEYFKLMFFIDNEEATEKREEQYRESNVPARYKKLSGNDRREIYEDFRLLKAIFVLSEKNIHGWNDMYDKEKKILQKKFKGPYGILKDDFNAMVTSYVENDDDYGSVDVERIITVALLALEKIKKDYRDLSNQETIDKFNTRKNDGGRKGSLEEKMHGIEGKTIHISIPSGKAGQSKTVSVNTDKFVQNIWTMFNNAYIRYCLVFNNIEEAFNDAMFLDYLVNENINASKDLVGKLLKIDYLVPYIARLVTNDELIRGKIVTDKVFLETIGNLLKRDSCIIHLKGLLIGIGVEKINCKKLEDLLKPNDDYPKNRIKSLFYEKFCSKIVECRIVGCNVDIENMGVIFEEPEYTEGILKVLSNKISCDEATPEEIILTKEILKLLISTAFKLYIREEYNTAQRLLDGKIGAQEVRKVLLKKNLVEQTDLDILQTKRFIAQIKNKQGKLEADTNKASEFHIVAYNILNSMKCTLGRLQSDALFPQFLLTLRDLAYTCHLLHKYQDAYTGYITVYEKMLKFTLDLPIGDSSRCVLSKEVYNRVAQSEKYKKILRLSPRHLNILKIRSDIAYEVKYLADTEHKPWPMERSLNYEAKLDDVLRHYQNALNIYEEVYEIKSTDAVGQDAVRTMRDIAYVHTRLGSLKTFYFPNEENLKQALCHYWEALEKYEIVYKVQAEEKWETHPAVLSTKQDIIRANRSVAFTHLKLGHLKSSNNTEGALKHYEEACEVNRMVLEDKRRTLGIENEYTLNTQCDLAFTINRLGKLKSKHNPVEALTHHEEASRLYEMVLEIQRKTLGGGNKKTLHTRGNIAFTNNRIKIQKRILHAEHNT